MERIYKYPRTRHLEGSRKQKGDENLNNIRFQEIKGKYLVLEEKVDGANCGISFDSHGRMYLQSRGHFLNGGYGERQFDLFKQWAGMYQEQLFKLLGSRYVMYGEWMYAKHTVFYDLLPHYFMEFDILDKKTERFFSTVRRRQLLETSPWIQSVLVLDEGYYDSVEEITRWIGPSHFISHDVRESLEKQCLKGRVDVEQTIAQTDLSGIMEGIYIKVEEGDYVINRLKYVRPTFLSAILDSESHWAARPMVANRLAEGRGLYGHEPAGFLMKGGREDEA
ncbi:MAG: RNA ligase family protein [Hungatella sp.]|nr:RNA ligase family protein [Hungatella sp.]